MTTAETIDDHAKTTPIVAMLPHHRAPHHLRLETRDLDDESHSIPTLTPTLLPHPDAQTVATDRGVTSHDETSPDETNPVASVVHVTTIRTTHTTSTILLGDSAMTDAMTATDTRATTDITGLEKTMIAIAETGTVMTETVGVETVIEVGIVMIGTTTCSTRGVILGATMSGTGIVATSTVMIDMIARRAVGGMSASRVSLSGSGRP